LRPAGELAYGKKRWLEIGVLLATEARMLPLDEPTAGMSAIETVATVTLVELTRFCGHVILNTRGV